MLAGSKSNVDQQPAISFTQTLIVNRTHDNQKFEYEVDGTVKWKLLGLTVYSQAKNWKGIALLK